MKFNENVWTLALGIGLLLVTSCQAQQNPAASSTIPATTLRIANLPFELAKPDFGGEASLSMALQLHGNNVDQDFVFDLSGVAPIHARGCTTPELIIAAKQMGIDTRTVWLTVDADKPNIQFANQMQELKADIRANTPWVVCLQGQTGQKLILISGVDVEQKHVLMHNPNHENGAYEKLSFVDLQNSWSLTDEQGRSFYVKLRVPPVRVRGRASTLHTDADYAQHIRKLKKKLPEGDFKILIQKPFVVIGDEDLQTVKRRSKNTVGWATQRLKERYFSKDPINILDIWLFKDKESYETNCKELFGRVPGTPYGYYSSFHRSLVMNISTGGGTLVHEIVHPFIESNFPECPSWFNEGFASLYEQCRDNDGVIWGSTNWRLRGLQLSIRDDRVPAFADLFSTSRDEFYNEDPGTNYSQGRYLCYYLQENDKLLEFYQTFRDNVKSDPTGLESLKKVLGQDDLAAFKKEWERYVMKLRF